MTKKLPLFYFEPTILWLDDNQLFLESASNLFNLNYHCLTFLDSTKALSFLKKYEPPTDKIHFCREFIESDIFDVHNHLPIDINISEIIKLANNIDIKNEIAVLVIDNNMPHITGVQLCHQLKDLPFKKILLTGETQPLAVIDAFNHGIIDKYISKSENNVIEKLKEAINELSHQYFYDRTKNLLSLLESSRFSPLSDPVFIEFFFNWQQTNSLQEFYLINRHGSFILKNNEKKHKYLIVMTEAAKNEFLKLNTDAPIQLNQILAQVERGELIPFFGIEKESSDFHYHDWHKFFYNANILVGREKYYWTSLN